MKALIDLCLRLAAIVLCLAVIGGLASLLGLIESDDRTLARIGWGLDLLVHFQIPYGVTILALAPLLALRRMWQSFTAVAFCAVPVGAMLWPYLPAGSGVARADTDTLTMVAINLWKDRVEPERLRRFLREVGADVVVITEASARWRTLLAEDFPHRMASLSHGMYLLSREPIGPPRSPLSGLPDAALAGELCRADGPARRCLTVIGMHTPSPTSRGRSLERDRELNEIGAAAAGHHARRLVLAGDLNTSPWGRGFRSMLARSGLQDSGWGAGWHPTWNSRWLVPVTPIDHILHTPDLRVIERFVGPDLGSDHLPITVRLAW